jgi:hypothetical protein
MPDPTRHPELDELEAARTGEAPPDVRDHVRTCTSCRRALADLEAVADALRIDAPPVPQAVEQQILWIARKEAASVRRAMRSRCWGALARRPGVAIAAGMLLALGVLRAVMPWQHAQMAPALVADVDGNGVVDIRDAFLIARAVGTAAEPAPRFDVNGDHVVDGGDVALAARTAVALGKPS